MIELDWEDIGGQEPCKRAKVFGGWLVKTFDDRHVLMHEDAAPQIGYEWQTSICFVPDTNHSWGNDNSKSVKFCSDHGGCGFKSDCEICVDND